jgi:hypothetical protein
MYNEYFLTKMKKKDSVTDSQVNLGLINWLGYQPYFKNKKINIQKG